jgi:SAM-dependent methyltransferase
MIATSNVACPVCRSPVSGQPLYKYSAYQAATHFCPATRNKDRHRRLEAAIRKLWATDECVILRCDGCGFAFGQPLVAGDEEFYTILHEQRGYPSWRWDYDVANAHALGNLDGGKILDFGAGSGVFLKSLGPEWSCHAIESSATNCSTLRAAGIQVLADLESACQTQAGAFSAISMFQVLEHIADFRSVLLQCRRLISPSGVLIITVPDGDAMIRQTRLTGCHDMPPNHIAKWTQHSLYRALRDTGFTPQVVVKEPGSKNHLIGSIHLRLQAQATNPRSLAAHVYKVQNKRLRVALLALAAISALPPTLLHLRSLWEGGALAVVAAPA